MSSLTTTSTSSAMSLRPRQLPGHGDRALRAGLGVGAVWGIAITIVGLGLTTTPDGHPFRHAADYAYTGLGIPLVLSALTVVHRLRAFAVDRDSRVGRWGTAVFTLAMAVFTAMFVDALAIGKASSWGPTYIMCVLASDIALGLVVASLWRTRALPRWLLSAWLLAWFIGGPLGPGLMPLLLTCAYITIAFQLGRSRQTRQDA